MKTKEEKIRVTDRKMFVHEQKQFEKKENKPLKFIEADNRIDQQQKQMPNIQ